ncbi:MULTISPECIES: DUF4494 domain-containing protein [Butyricimonas]|uniref:DUF4494 domain-containing protein n=1 Tax=Butyricimonas TaxID=574697 RepID=UPI000364FD07|nr:MULTISPECIES: DUF4494 domain-containing protein [Butyricimonas]
MTANWFEAKVKYVKVGEDGKERKMSESYLLDAMSYTEAESRITESLREMIQGDFYIAGLKKSNVTELVESNDGNDDKWFKAKVNIIDADQISGKEKKSAQYFLVAGSDLERALANLQKSLSTYVVPFEIASLADTTIMDVFPYFSDDAEQTIPSNLKPLGSMEANTEEFE